VLGARAPGRHSPTEVAGWAVYWLTLASAVLLAFEMLGYSLAASVAERHANAYWIKEHAFRAFRAKSFEATILLITAFIVMLGRVPVGTSIWGGFATISEWILSTINMAGSRAITLGAAVGATAACLKIILGLETRYLGGE